MSVDPQDYAPPESGSEDSFLYNQIHLGVQAKDFLNSDVAKYICNTAEKKVIEAQNELSKVNPTDTNKIIELQSIVAKFDHFVTSLAEIVSAGDSAYQIYLQNQESRE